MTMQLHRPDGEGGLTPSPVTQDDYRRQLRSRRWDAAQLSNPEVELPDKRLAVLGIVILAVMTFGAIVVGYGIGLWG
ncbi:MAG: hypothetical protein KF809_00780 [Chloroflexi bacterium]|nr:hypothetical protein [Chloroflexota bacterium]